MGQVAHNVPGKGKRIRATRRSQSTKALIRSLCEEATSVQEGHGRWGWGALVVGVLEKLVRTCRILECTEDAESSRRAKSTVGVTLRTAGKVERPEGWDLRGGGGGAGPAGQKEPALAGVGGA